MSATFQRMMDNLLRGLEDSSAAYIDDVVVHSVTWADHLSALRAVLTTLKEAGLTAKPGKCHFAGHGRVQPSRSYGREWTSTYDQTTARSQQWKRSQHQFKDKEESQSRAGTHRIFIPDYATVAAPLTELTKKETPNKVIWSDVCEEALQTRTSPVLKCPDFQLP